MGALTNTARLPSSAVPMASSKDGAVASTAQPEMARAAAVGPWGAAPAARPQAQMPSGPQTQALAQPEPTLATQTFAALETSPNPLSALTVVILVLQEISSRLDNTEERMMQ